MIRFATLPLLAVVALLTSPASVPQQAPAGGAATAYMIEIVVFRNGGAEGAEDLAEAQRNLSVSADSDSGASDAARNSRLIQVLSADRYRLGDAVSRLNASGGHRTIARAAWLQTASAWNSRSGIPVEQLGLGSAGLSGVVYVERGQYLHLGFNMGLGAGKMVEIRRVRLNERQYFDHPAFGVIAVVSPATAAQ